MELLNKTIATLIDTTAINSSYKTTRNNTNIFVKKRKWGRGVLIFFGNIFLKLSSSTIYMFISTKKWQEWELHSFKLLYPQYFSALENEGILLEELPGKSLLEYLKQNTLTDEMISATVQELKRAHTLNWSHGDPHLENILFDEKNKKAFLIDFETKHEKTYTTTQKKANDLLVLILDIVGRVQAEKWMRFVEIIIKQYNNQTILEELQTQLVMPTGWKRILWCTRTNFISNKLLQQRLDSINKFLSSKL